MKSTKARPLLGAVVGPERPEPDVAGDRRRRPEQVLQAPSRRVRPPSRAGRPRSRRRGRPGRAAGSAPERRGVEHLGTHGGCPTAPAATAGPPARRSVSEGAPRPALDAARMRGEGVDGADPGRDQPAPLRRAHSGHQQEVAVRRHLRGARSSHRPHAVYRGSPHSASAVLARCSSRIRSRRTRRRGVHGNDVAERVRRVAVVAEEQVDVGVVGIPSPASWSAYAASCSRAVTFACRDSLVS